MLAGSWSRCLCHIHQTFDILIVALSRIVQITARHSSFQSLNPAVSPFEFVFTYPHSVVLSIDVPFVSFVLSFKQAD
jgi:hypothetical protein